MYIQPEDEARIAAWARGVASIRRCWVFGSRAGSQFRHQQPRETSDLDIGVEIDLSDRSLVERHLRGVDQLEAWQLWFYVHTPWEDEIQALVSYKVDLRLIERDGGATILGKGAKLLYTRPGYQANWP